MINKPGTTAVLISTKFVCLNSQPVVHRVSIKTRMCHPKHTDIAVKKAEIIPEASLTYEHLGEPSTPVIKTSALCFSSK